MATVINNPGTTTTDSNGIGFLLGVLLVIIFAVVFFVYGLPYIANTFRASQVNIPGQIDVNVNAPK